MAEAVLHVPSAAVVTVATTVPGEPRSETISTVAAGTGEPGTPFRFSRTTPLRLPGFPRSSRSGATFGSVEVMFTVTCAASNLGCPAGRATMNCPSCARLNR